MRRVQPSLIGLALSTGFAFATGLAFTAWGAAAQQASNTARLALFEPIGSVLIYDDPQPQNAFLTRAAFDTLVCYDHDERTFRPLLARSWRQPDPLTLEFELRDDVRFHDGAPLTAGDVAYTVNWLIDPSSPYRFKENFSFVAEASAPERLLFRLKLREPNAAAMIRIATSLFILPRHIHEGLADRSAFGRRAMIGSGPYRITSVDSSRGVVLEKSAAYPQAASCKPAAQIGRIQALPMPDVQTQAAQLLTGGLELMRITARETSEMFAGDKRFTLRTYDGMMLQYVAFDAANRAGNPALADPRVRRALAMAIDRATVAANVSPGDNPPPAADALCLPVQIACGWTKAPPPFDRAAAKALLAQTPWPNGFDVEITAFASASQLAEAIAGELYKIGVRAKVDRASLAAYRQKQRDGKLQILVGLWTSGGLPDPSPTIDLFFAAGPRDYWRDVDIRGWAAQALRAPGEAERKMFYSQINDRVNELTYILPIAGKPEAFMGVRELDTGRGSLNGYGIEANELRWR